MSLALARRLVLSYGWNTTSYQILNSGMDLWFSATHTAVVGYIRRNGSLVVAGAPVCPPEHLAQVCSEFEEFAVRQQCRVCYFCAEDRLRRLFHDSAGHATVTLGAQPVWDPRAWPELMRRRSSLRAQVNRSRNKGVVVTEIDPEQGAGSEELREVLREWLTSRQLPPLHFLVEPNVLSGPVGERVVLTAALHGSVVAYLVASPIAARNGYLVELIARSPAAPNGTSELLIDAAMRRFAREGRHLVTLGLVALSDAARDAMQENPAWLTALMRFARLHANRFYNFRGLEHFRIKLCPGRWDPVYAISNERRFSVRTLYSIGAAFSGISPVRAVAMGAAKALRQEAAALAASLAQITRGE